MTKRKLIGLLALTSLTIYNGYWVVNGATLFDIFKYWTFQTNLMVAVYCLSGYQSVYLETYLSIYISITMLGSILLFREMVWWHKVFILIDHVITPLLFIINFSNEFKIKWTIVIYPITYILFYKMFQLEIYNIVLTNII